MPARDGPGPEVTCEAVRNFIAAGLLSSQVCSTATERRERPLGTLDEAIAQAKKILGEKASIPKPKINRDKLSKDWQVAFSNFDKARNDIESKLVALENTLSAYSNANKQYAALLEKEDFGLNSKSPDDAKKIKKAREVFATYFASKQTLIDKDMKSFDELDKHIIQLTKYEGQCP
jgi:hypothetical protein